MIDLDDLKRKARAASRGQWEAEGNAIKGTGFYWTLSDVVDESHNAAYIAAAQPAVILDLIEQYRRRVAELARFRTFLNDATQMVYLEEGPLAGALVSHAIWFSDGETDFVSNDGGRTWRRVLDGAVEVG